MKKRKKKKNEELGTLVRYVKVRNLNFLPFVSFSEMVF